MNHKYQQNAHSLSPILNQESQKDKNKTGQQLPLTQINQQNKYSLDIHPSSIIPQAQYFTPTLIGEPFNTVQPLLSINKSNAQKQHLPDPKTSQQFTLLYSKSRPSSLIILRKIQKIRNLLVENIFPTQYISLDNIKDQTWKETINLLKKDTGIEIILFQKIEDIENYTKNNKDRWLILLCSPNLYSESLLIQKLPFVCKVLYYQPFLNDQSINLLNLIKNYKDLCYFINQFNIQRCSERKFQNCLFLNSSDVGFSHRIVRTMNAMLNQNLEQQVNHKLIDQLRKLYENLFALSKDFYSSEEQMDLFFNDLKKGTTSQKYINWYTKSQICNFKILNTLLRSAKHPSQFFYIQPYFKQLFCSIQNIYKKQFATNDIVCYRGAWISDQQLQKFVKHINKVVLGMSFLSTSLNIKTAQKFGSKIFKINVNHKEGDYTKSYGFANISKYSYFAEEQQILFNPLNSFRIKKVYYCSKIQTDIIELEYGVFQKYLGKPDESLSEDQRSSKMIGKLHIDQSYRVKCQGDALIEEGFNLEGAQIYWQLYQKISEENNEEERKKHKVIYTYKKAKIQQNKNKLLKAEQLYEKNNMLLKKWFFEKNEEIAASLNNLGTIYQRNGKLTNALLAYQQCRNIYIKYNIYSLGYFKCMINIGSLHQQMGNYKFARKIEQNTIMEVKSKLGKWNLIYFALINNLGSCSLALAQYEQAIIQYQEAREICSKVLGTAHPYYAICLNNLGQVFEQLGQYPRASQLYQQSRYIKECLLGENSQMSYMQFYIQKIGKIKMISGQLKEAQLLFLRNKELVLQNLSKDHPEYAVQLVNIASLSFSRGLLDQSVQQYIESKNIFQNIYGENHPKFIKSLIGIADVYVKKQQYELSLEFYEKARKIIQNIFGKEHPNFAKCLIKIADVRRAKCQYGLAVKLLKESLKIILKRFDLNLSHRQFIKVWKDLSDCFHGLQKKAPNLLELLDEFSLQDQIVEQT